MQAILHFTPGKANLKLVKARKELCGGQRVSARLPIGMDEVNAQQPSYFAIEVDFTTLDVGPEQSAWTHIKNSSNQSQTIRMDKSPNTNAVTDLQMCHRSLS
jgi:hypothetical protein